MMKIADGNDNPLKLDQYISYTPYYVRTWKFNNINSVAPTTAYTKINEIVFL